MQIVLGQVLIATQGYAAPVVGETYARARALCEQLDRPPQIVPVIYGQGVHHLLKGPLRIAQEIAANLLQLGEETGKCGSDECGTRAQWLDLLSAWRIPNRRARIRKKQWANLIPRTGLFSCRLLRKTAK